MKQKEIFLKNIFKDSHNIPLIAITGICKNAGKTTLLNWLTDNIPSGKSVAILTTGRDGEDYDLVGGHEKPKVSIPAGTIFATHTDIITRFHDRVEVLEKSDYKTGPYTVWVARALQSLESEIIGPSSAYEQIRFCMKLKEYNPDYILIDGSLDRKAITLHPEVEKIILVVSADFGTIEEIIEELNRLLLLTKCSNLEKNFNRSSYCYISKSGREIVKFDSLLGNEKAVSSMLLEDKNSDYIYIPGVFTSSMWKILKVALSSFKGRIIINHPYQLQLGLTDLKILLKSVEIFSINRFKIDGVVLNSYSVKGRHIDAQVLREKISKESNIPVVDITEVY